MADQMLAKLVSDIGAEMKRRRLTVDDLAALAGVPVPTAAAILSGTNSRPRMSVVVKLADALDSRRPSKSQPPD
jgi:transcriptional regulator with XRE-family HTH domain